jgi:hypothetical protein
MKTIRKTVEVPVNRRIHVDIGLFPADGARYMIDLAPTSRDEIGVKSRAAREKLRELTKVSTLTGLWKKPSKNTLRTVPSDMYS